MADSSSLRIMCIFEAGARMRYNSELVCMAAHIYHRFFRIRSQTGLYDLNVFAAAAIHLANRFFEKKFNFEDLCFVMMDILNGPELYIDNKTREKLIHSIELAAKIICINLDFQINFKDTRWTTPGQLQEQYREQRAQMAAKKAPLLELDSEEDDSSSSSSSDEERIVPKSDRLLATYDKYLPSSHRYLVHYLKAIKIYVEPDAMEYFVKVSNVAWTFMCDFYWSSCVTQLHSSHLACACIMLSVEIFRPILEKGKKPERLALLKALDRKWNLIFCEDFTDNHLKRARDLIIEQYNEYERVLQHELSTFVIDPQRRN